jgi:hypothetical protein
LEHLSAGQRPEADEQLIGHHVAPLH